MGNGPQKTLSRVWPHGAAPDDRSPISAYAEDIRIRTEGLEHEAPNGYQVDVHEIRVGPVYQHAGVRVTAIPVMHGNWPQAYAYRIDTTGRSIVISGDTRPCEALVRASQGVDVLVHEVYSAAKAFSSTNENKDQQEKDWPRYLREFHTSDLELGALAARIKPKLLVLTHIVRMKATDEELLKGSPAADSTERPSLATIYSDTSVPSKMV